MLLRLGAMLSMVLVCMSGATAWAQSGRIVLEWDRWMAAQGVTSGALVFQIENSELLAQDSGASVDAALPLASNSKAITAQCVAALVEAGELAWTDPLSRWFGKAGGAVTVAQLITHTSGYWPDKTQSRMARWRNDPTNRWAEVTQTAQNRLWQRGIVGDYRYNNENYAVLGTLIERITGKDYAAACQALVLVPLGITTARLSEDFGGYGPWGGWEMSVRDCALLMTAVYSAAEPLTTPHVSLGGGSYYGLGMLFRVSQHSVSHWHFGRLCFRDGGIGAYAVNWAGRYTVVAAYDACLSDEAMVALDQAMIKAVFSD
jgi:CubicO group peptidase (beta-lactamase class C family)